MSATCLQINPNLLLFPITLCFFPLLISPPVPYWGLCCRCCDLCACWSGSRYTRGDCPATRLCGAHIGTFLWMDEFISPTFVYQSVVFQETCRNCSPSEILPFSQTWLSTAVRFRRYQGRRWMTDKLRYKWKDGLHRKAQVPQEMRLRRWLWDHLAAPLAAGTENVAAKHGKAALQSWCLPLFLKT